MAVRQSCEYMQNLKYDFFFQIFLYINSVGFNTVITELINVCLLQPSLSHRFCQGPPCSIFGNYFWANKGAVHST